MCRRCIQITLSSRVAIVGRNGAGKSTLLRTLVGELPLLDPDAMWRHHNLRVAYVSQHHIDKLQDCAASSPVQYLCEQFHIVTELKVWTALSPPLPALTTTSASHTCGSAAAAPSVPTVTMLHTTHTDDND